MTDKNNYFGFDNKPRLSLDAMHQADRVPLQPVSHFPNKSEITQKPSEIEIPSAPEIIAEARPYIKERLGRPIEGLIESTITQINELVYEGDYRFAYSIHCQTGVDVSNDPGFREVLENIVDDAMRGNIDDVDGRYFRLFYLLGEDFDVNSILGLKELIVLVFDKYKDHRLPANGGDKPLNRLAKLFRSQIDFGWYEDDDGWE